MFLYDLQRFGKGEFVKTVDHKGLKCYRFSLPKNLLYNVENNKANSIYYQYGPNGMGNLTSVVLGPVFVSKSFFYGTDPTVVKAINFTNWQVPDEEDYAKFDTFFDIEKYSGANFYCKLQI